MLRRRYAWSSFHIPESFVGFPTAFFCPNSLGRSCSFSRLRSFSRSCSSKASRSPRISRYIDVHRQNSPPSPLLFYSSYPITIFGPTGSLRSPLPNSFGKPICPSPLKTIPETVFAVRSFFCPLFPYALCNLDFPSSLSHKPNDDMPKNPSLPCPYFLLSHLLSFPNLLALIPS